MNSNFDMNSTVNSFMGDTKGKFKKTFISAGIGAIVMIIALLFIPSPYSMIFVLAFVGYMIYVSLNVTKEIKNNASKMTQDILSGVKTQDIPNGILSPATITNVQQSNVNMSMGNVQYYKMLIDVNVDATDGASWAGQIKQMVPLAQLSVLTTGNKITVKYDPNNHSSIILN